MRENYYVGLDIGTDSVGWAVTDRQYNLLRAKGKDMWGAYLFDPAKTAAERRGYRTARRRTARVRQRIKLLQELFAPEVYAVDPAFFIRMEKSKFVETDKTIDGKDAIFHDEAFGDKEFYKKFPTIYHLRAAFLDLQQARVDFNADSSQYINQQELVQASLIRLNELMAGPDVNAPLQICDSLIRVNSRLEEGELLKRMLQTNASLLKADRNTALAGLDLKTLQARNYPYVKLNAGYGYQLNRYGNNANRQRQTWGPDVGATLGITLFDGNRRREQRNARIQIENAELTRQQLELSLRADLADFWQAYRNNLELLKLEEENLVAATENHEIAMERYLLGDLSGIEMREAQKSLLDAEERILSAQYNTKLCEISLQQISGNILSYLE